MSNEAAKTASNNPFDIFIVGLKKGLNIGLYSLLPNVVMAFVLTYILQLWGVMDFLGRTCGGIMGIFDLPGQAITVLLATWMSCGAGVGVLKHDFRALLARSEVVFQNTIVRGWCSSR